LVFMAGILSACSTTTTATKAPSMSTNPATATPAQPSGAARILPIASNPIVNTSTNASLKITYSAAENNIDPVSKLAIGDRLEITLMNTGKQQLTGLEIYYEMRDVVTKAKEGYYQKLSGLSIPAGQSSTIYFDGLTQPGHYPENQFSLYRSSPNEVDISIVASATGVRVAHASAIKSLGTGEKPGA
jgi:hypothetical protein